MLQVYGGKQIPGVEQPLHGSKPSLTTISVVAGATISLNVLAAILVSAVASLTLVATSLVLGNLLLVGLLVLLQSRMQARNQPTVNIRPLVRWANTPRLVRLTPVTDLRDAA